MQPVKAVSALVRDMRRLSAVVIDADALRGDAQLLVHSIKEQQPDLPIFWFTDGDGDASKVPRKVELVGSDLKKKLQPRISEAIV